jgi:hypothetical protein
MTSSPTPKLNQSDACEYQLNTRSFEPMGVKDSLCVVFAICFPKKNGSSARPSEHGQFVLVGRASLREDYLNQVQRDFLSLGSM